jgi:uncharacterized membrane protein
MNRIAICGVAVVLLGLTACKRSEPGGGPDRGTKFTIDGPMTTTSIQQGDTDTVALKINRGKEFKETVKLKVEAPSGLQVAVHDSTVKPSEKGDINLKVAVAKDTTPGEHVIHVVGTPDTGAATSLDVTVKVTERTEKNTSGKTTMSIQGPYSATSVKRGESQTIKLTVDGSEKANGEIKMKADAPKGVTAEFTSGSPIRPADKGVANLHVTADKSAELGDHTIRVTGSADGATINPMDVKIRVVAP